MNILDVLRARMKLQFPGISRDELQLRINLAYEMIKNVR